MRQITVIQEIQSDGAIHHVSGLGCPLEPCATIIKQGEVPTEICDYLHAGSIDDEGNLLWQCNKPMSSYE